MKLEPADKTQTRTRQWTSQAKSIETHFNPRNPLQTQKSKALDLLKKQTKGNKIGLIEVSNKETNKKMIESRGSNELRSRVYSEEERGFRWIWLARFIVLFEFRFCQLVRASLSTQVFRVCFFVSSFSLSLQLVRIWY